MRVAFAQFVDGLLVADHAAHESDKQVAAFCLGMFQHGKLVVRLLFWRFTHAARIEYHEVSLIHARLLPAQFIEHGLDALGISLVHLAPNGPDMVFPARNTAGRGHRVAPLRACYEKY